MHGSHDTGVTWYMQYSIFFAYLWQSLFLKTNMSYDYVTFAGEQNGLWQSLFLKTNMSYDYVTYAGEQNGL